MKAWLARIANTWTAVETALIGTTIVLVMVAFLARAIYLAWN
jgi:preprotein translocase subunit SecE